MSIGNFKVKHYIKKRDVEDITKNYFNADKELIFQPRICLFW